jgi:hypothetical protein
MKALVKLFILLMVLVNIAKAQVVLPMGLGQKNSLNITCSEGDKIWVVSNENEKIVVNKWDGNFWIQYTEIPSSILNIISTLPQSIVAKAAYFYNNELYLALTNKYNDRLLLIKNSGRNWATINTETIKVSSKLTFLSTPDGLLLCGKITVDNQLITILKVGKSDCSIYAGLSANHGANDYYTDFENINNTIWAFGYFTVNTESRYFAKLDQNKNWNIVSQTNAPPFTNGNLAIGKYKQKLIIAGTDFDFYSSFCVQKTDTTWGEISNGLADWKINSISDMRQIGQNFWVAGKFTHTKTNNLASLAYWNGTIWTVPDYDYNYLGNDLKLNGNTSVYISGSFTNYQGLLLNHVGILNLENAIVAGKVFNDINQNCTQEFGENSISGAVIKLMPENIFTMTDYNGRYYFPIDSSNKIQHFIELQIPKYNEATCSSLKPAIISTQPTLASINFGLRVSGIHTDASVKVNDYTGWRARQGFEENYLLCAENKGTKKIESGKLVLKVDSRLTNWVFSEQPSSWQNSTLEWNLKPMQVGEKYCIRLKATIPVEIALESEILFDAKILIGDLQDEDVTNNTSILKQKIVAAIDPNDKRTEQNYYITPTQKVLDYKIRFQNTGTDTAYNIFITDSIDPNLAMNNNMESDVSHYKNLKSSGTYWIQPNGKYAYKLAWHFNNILLPDNKTNEEASNGFINYRLNIANSLPLGTTIRNRAYIYFDYQEPILTNVAKNVVSLEGGIKSNLPASQLSFYPNPATDFITITNPLKKSVSINIISSLGQIVLTKTITADSKLSISTAFLAKGIYLIQAQGYSPVKLVVN